LFLVVLSVGLLVGFGCSKKVPSDEQTSSNDKGGDKKKDQAAGKDGSADKGSPKKPGRDEEEIDPKKVDEKAAQKELGRLLGEWKVVAVDADGKTDSRRGSPNRLVFKFDFIEGLTPNLMYFLDPKRKPGAIDLVLYKEDSTKITTKGFYEIKGDTLRLAIPGGKGGGGTAIKTHHRPTSFKTSGKKVIVITAKRALGGKKGRAVSKIKSFGAEIKFDKGTPRQPVKVTLPPEAARSALPYLNDLPTLRSVEMELAKGISDADLVHLEGLKNLRKLTLDHTPISDAGLAHLKGLTRLEELSLMGTKVGDAGLAHLRGLTSLRSLNITDTRVTKKGITELQKALPKLKITRDDEEG
jgi:uncharacterized protein (TIGR03067 family)